MCIENHIIFRHGTLGFFPFGAARPSNGVIYAPSLLFAGSPRPPFTARGDMAYRALCPSPMPHHCRTNRPAIDSLWCPMCSGLRDIAIIADDFLCHRSQESEEEPHA
jgi:hypothetical protein